MMLSRLDRPRVLRWRTDDVGANSAVAAERRAAARPAGGPASTARCTCAARRSTRFTVAIDSPWRTRTRRVGVGSSFTTPHRRTGRDHYVARRRPGPAADSVSRSDRQMPLGRRADRAADGSRRSVDGRRSPRRRRAIAAGLERSAPRGRPMIGRASRSPTSSSSSGDLDRRPTATGSATLLVDPLLQTGTWDAPTGRRRDRAAARGHRPAWPTRSSTPRDQLGVPIAGRRPARRFDCTAARRRRRARRSLAASPAGQPGDRAVVRRARSSRVRRHPRRRRRASRPASPIRDLDDDAARRRSTSERGLSLDLAELHAMAAPLPRRRPRPTDVELETLAQTWSEHCAHKTFRARITHRPTARERHAAARASCATATDAIDAPFVRQRVRRQRRHRRRSRPAPRIALKAETHNHPSAIEPFGGANTGVGGVIRDVLGAAHRPIAVTDVLCFGPPDLPADELPDGVLHPRRIRERRGRRRRRLRQQDRPADRRRRRALRPRLHRQPARVLRLHRRRRRRARCTPARTPATASSCSAGAPAATASAAPRSRRRRWTPPPARSPGPACRSATRSSRSC